MDPLAVMRALQVAATLSAFGALLFRAAVAPVALAQVDADVADRLGRGLAVIVRASIVAALAAAAAWLPFQAAAMSGAGSMGEAMAAVPVVLFETVFGHALLLRVVLLAAALVLFGRGCRPLRSVGAAGLAGVACIAQAGMGHPAAAATLILPAAVMAHLLAAGAWLGGLAPLWLTVRRLPRAAAECAARRFSAIGMASVSVLAATAIVQGWYLLGGVAGILDTPYGELAQTKVLLFAALIGLAAVNWRIFTPNLARDPMAGGHLRRSIAAETGLGMIVVLAASSMATLPPGSMRMATSDTSDGARQFAVPMRPAPEKSSAVRPANLVFASHSAGGRMPCS